jgi:CheY-like chemotaxis protein
MKSAVLMMTQLLSACCLVVCAFLTLKLVTVIAHAPSRRCRAAVALGSVYTLNVRILFVENHQAFAEIVVTQFLAEHDVVTVSKVSQARSLAQESRFDAILVDYDLDDGKGSELVESLRSAGFRGIIVAVSSHDDGNRALLRAGANAACRKTDFRNISSILKAASSQLS